MKNKITLLTTLLLCSLFTNAQTNYQFDKGDNYGDGTKNMIGQREYVWNTNTLQWDDVDSFDLHHNTLNQLTLRKQWEYDTTGGGAWKNKQITKLTYTAAGMVESQVDTAPNPTSGHRYEYTYNGNNREIQLLDRIWSQTTQNWGNYRKYSTSRTAFDSINVYLEEGWNPVSNIWVNGSRLIHTYNAQNLDSTMTYENWFNANNQWVTGGRYIYTYNAAGKWTMYLNQNYDTSFAVFKNNYKYEYTYDGANRILSNIQSNWNPNINIWQNAWRYTYTYNAQGLLETTQVEKWNIGTLQWDLWTFFTYTYDANNRLITELYQNRVNGAWENASRQSYTRDANGYRTRYVSETWNTNTLAWRNWNAIDYWYETKQTNGIAEQVEDQLFVYPNPSNSPVLFVNADKNLPYTIYDLTGRLVQQGSLQPGTNTVTFNEAKGIYLLNAGNGTTRIIKQ